MEFTAYLERCLNRRHQNTPQSADEKPVHAYQRVKALLKAMSFRHKDLRVWHIVGSKGKGSTGAILAHSLYRMGLSSVLFTSPHVYNLTERFKIDGKDVSVSAINSALRWVEEQDPLDELYFFEVMTVVACWIAKEACVQFLIMEAGIGGRLDATRLGLSEAVIITPIELEHTQMLGETLAAIAHEKAAVVRSGMPVFCAQQSPEVLGVLRQVAAKKGAPFYYLPDEVQGFFSHVGYPRTQCGWLQGSHPVLVRLPSSHPEHAMNAALALLILETMLKAKPQEVYHAWKRAVRLSLLPGRFETMWLEPLWIFDGSHTPNSVAGVLETFFSIVQSQPCTLVFGCAADKNALALSQHFGAFHKILFTAPGKQAHTMGALYEQRRTQLPQLSYHESPFVALSEAYRFGWPTLILGSFYLGQEVLSFLPGQRPMLAGFL